MEDRRVLSGIAFSDFGDATGLSLVGDAAIANGNVLRLTPAAGGMAGAAWYVADKPFVSIDWETMFAFNLNENADPPGGSDGFTFVIQNYQPTYLSGGGGTLGYANLPNSVVVEFDTFQNSEANDPSQSHISVHTNGTGPNSWDEALSLGCYNTPTIIDDAATHTAKISYVPGILKVFLNDLVNPVITASIDLSEILSLDAGHAWVGFTAATGGGYQNHDILNWQFDLLADTSKTLAVNDASVIEGDSGTRDMSFTVTRSGDTTGTTTVAWTTENRTATAGSDFVAANGQLVFGPGEVEQTILMPISGDSIVEPYETLAVRLFGATGSVIADGVGIGTIENDDVSLSISDATVTEGEAGYRFIDAIVPEKYGHLADPRGVTVGPNGDIFVGSVTTAGVLRYDGETGKCLGVFADVSEAGFNTRLGTVLFHDGDLYVSTGASNSVLRFDGHTGDPRPAPGKNGAAFVTASDGGLDAAWGMSFGPDGNLYVASGLTNEILVYNGVTGNFDGVFVPAGDHGLSQPLCMSFGGDGNLYVGSSLTNQVLRYQGPYGPTPGGFMDEFVTAGSGGLAFPPAAGLGFGPDGDLYVSSRDSDSVLRYDGSSGGFMEAVVAAGSGGLDQPKGIAFDNNGFLLVSNGATDEILRFGEASSAVFTVTLPEPVPFDVAVDYTTANGTALAGVDYLAANGTLLIPAGQTSKSIIVTTLDDGILEASETFLIRLSNPTPGVVLDDEGIGRIFDKPVPLFSDSFESGEWNGLWVENSHDGWHTSTQRQTDGSYSAEVYRRAADATLTIASPINLTPYGSAEFSFDWFIESSLDNGEYLALDLFNGTNWQEVAKLRGTVDTVNAWLSPVINIESAYLVSNFQFRFRATMNAWDEDANVDNVRLIATSLAGPPNQLPLAMDDTAMTVEDTAATIDVLANDSDPEWDALQIQSLTQGSHGAVVDNGNGTLTYTPQANYFGSDSFTYTIIDGRGGTDTANVAITITPVNDAPAALNDLAMATPNQSVTISVLENDFDLDGDTLNVDSYTSPTNGSVSNLEGGLLQYTPSLDFTGSDQFTYTISDGHGGTDTAIVSIIVQTTSSMHVSDLDGSARWVNKTKWTATVVASVRDGSGLPVPNATVQGTWSNGTTSTTTTNNAGQATLSSGNVDKSIGSVTFTVTNITHTSFQYDPAVNTDPDADSEGTVITVFKPQALLAASSTNYTAPAGDLTDPVAQATVSEALALWSQQIAPALPPDVYIQLADIPTGFLGWTSGNTIILDVNADGAGWYTDLGAPPAGRVDLLTVVSHEIGHVLGCGHSHAAGDLMYGSLTPGTRRLPDSEAVTMAVPLESALVSSLLLLLLPEQMDVSLHDLVDHSLLAREGERNAGADSDAWMLSLVTADYAAQPPRTSDTVRAQIAKTVTDEESELLDEELLDLLAASRS